MKWADEVKMADEIIEQILEGKSEGSDKAFAAAIVLLVDSMQNIAQAIHDLKPE